MSQDKKTTSLKEDKFHIYDANGKLITERALTATELEEEKKKLTESGVQFQVKQLLFS